MRPFVKKALFLGALGGISYALWRALAARQSEAAFEWEAQPFPYPPTPAAPDEAPTATETEGPRAPEQ